MAGYRQPSKPAVIRAIYDLRNGDHGPTSEEIAKYLEVGQNDVKIALRDLHAQRLFRARERKRDGVRRKEWAPWGAR